MSDGKNPEQAQRAAVAPSTSTLIMELAAHRRVLKELVFCLEKHLNISEYLTDGAVGEAMTTPRLMQELRTRSNAALEAARRIA